MGYEKPIPLKTQDNKPYWDAADEHKLKLQRCNNCKKYSHPPGPSCTNCGSTDMIWEDFGSDVKGKVYSYIIGNRPFLPGFQDDIPLVIAQMELDEAPGVLIIGNILKVDPAEVKIGMPVKMIWKDITEDRALPQWKTV